MSRPAKKKAAAKLAGPHAALYRASLAYVKRHGGNPVVQGGVSIISNLPGQRPGSYLVGIHFLGGPIPHFKEQP